MIENKNKIEKIVKYFWKKLPKFPDGRIDFSKSKIVPCISCFVIYDNKILILKRGDKVASYKGLWNSIAGYVDDLLPIENKIYEELQEEIGLIPESIKKITFGKLYKFKDKNINKTWIILPVLVDLDHQPKIVLDWEHINYAWIDPSKINNYNTFPNLEIIFKRLI